MDVNEFAARAALLWVEQFASGSRDPAVFGAKAGLAYRAALEAARGGVSTSAAPREAESALSEMPQAPALHTGPSRRFAEERSPEGSAGSEG